MTTTEPAVTDSSPLTLRSRFDVTDGDIYITGVQALIRVLIDQARADARAGVRTAGFVSGYPGSPLGGVDIEFGRQAKLLAEHNIRHLAGLNEDLAATALFGTQMVAGRPDATVDGVFGMWYGKAPGVDRSGDAFRHGNYRGTSRFGGILAVAGDDPAAKSTIIPSDSNRAFEDWFMPTLFPGDVQDVIDLGLHGYALSRASGLWCGFKIVTNVADSSGSASVGFDRVRPQIPTIEFRGAPFEPAMRPNVAGHAMLQVEEEIFYARLEVARLYGRVNGLNPITLDGPRPRVGIIAPGRAYFDLRQSLRDLGLDESMLSEHGVRLMKIGLLSPVDEHTLRTFANGLEQIVVIEDKRPLLESALKQALYGTPKAPLVIGKFDEQRRPLFPAHGELTADAISRALGPRLHQLIGADSIAHRLKTLQSPRRNLLPLAVDRTAYFCSGCPHNRSLPVPDGALVGAGIGCHIMALGAGRDDYGEIAGYTHMGAEGVQWIGMEPYVRTPHLFQNLGDGTFHHSGSLAIRFAVACGINITYKLLYNGAVGMTGGQEVQGAIPVPELTTLLASEGVQRIVVTTDDVEKYRGVDLASIATVRERDDLLAVQAELAATPGVTVLIHDQMCAAERRRLRKRGDLSTPTTRIFVNERVCEMCGDCGAKSNCLSVQTVATEFGQKTKIHQSSCNLDYSCVLGDCPSFITVDVSEAQKPRPEARVDLPDAPVEPIVHVGDTVTIQMVGIGGTGVVTVSQVLATAATLDGRFVRDLDLTGSSQKAGPVVSQLQMSPAPVESAGYFSEGGVDTYLVFDLLTGVSSTNMERADRDRTIAVVSTSAVPTGRMAAHSELAYPGLADLRQRLESRTRAEDNVYVDALDVAHRLFGDHMLGNMVLIGAAYQAGCLGISASSIERAIDLNGVAVERNRSAFRWGRWLVSDPDKVRSLLTARAAGPDEIVIDPRIRGLEVAPELARIISIRLNDLIDYGSRAYAKIYLDELCAAQKALRNANLADDRILTNVARQLHRVMAYKDEYEVARLHTSDVVRRQVIAQFGEGATFAFQLQPPILRALGLRHKIAVGQRLEPALRLLARGKRLRNTRLDPFGFARVRRLERGLVEHYRALINDATRATTATNSEPIANLLDMIDSVRGYEEIKVHNALRYRRDVESAAAALGIPTVFGRAFEIQPNVVK
jgi:indolepyruvate ferredoxin oxidoreductase